MEPKRNLSHCTPTVKRLRVNMHHLTPPLLAACLLEVTSRKPGNVHPLARFEDCDWNSFCASAEAITPVLARGRDRGLGETVFRAVEATRARVGRNTNLGMILLLAPLAAAEGVLSSDPVEAVLNKTTNDDCRLVYEAIRLARPGGLGRVEDADVHEAPGISLIAAMRLAAGRDAIARQYVTGFADVFRLAERFGATELPELEREIVRAYLEQLAWEPDSLIARKCGIEIATEASTRARQVLEDDGAGLRELDEWLRADGNRRNPGTTADLIAAVLFVAIRRGLVPSLPVEKILKFGEDIQRSGSPICFI